MVAESFSYILGGVHRLGINREIEDGALSEPQGRAMGRADGVEVWELVDELGKEPIAGALEAADAAHVRNLSSAEPLRKQVHEKVVELPDAFVFDARHVFLKEWPYASNSWYYS